MSGVLQGLIGICCEVFVDDVVVYGEDERQFIAALERVFDRLKVHDLRLKAAKCEFGVPGIEYLGHIVTGEGVALSASRRQGIADIVQPASKAKLKSFLGLANFFKSFVRGFAQLAAPLHTLCSSKQKFTWQREHQQAFVNIRGAIVVAPMLWHVD